jgi:hypothetical protein
MEMLKTNTNRKSQESRNKDLSENKKENKR